MNKQKILDTISDAMADLLYYDRKEDQDLGVGDIERAIKAGIITEEEIYNEIIREFKSALKD